MVEPENNKVLWMGVAKTKPNATVELEKVSQWVFCCSISSCWQAHLFVTARMVNDVCLLLGIFSNSKWTHVHATQCTATVHETIQSGLQNIKNCSVVTWWVQHHSVKPQREQMKYSLVCVRVRNSSSSLCYPAGEALCWLKKGGDTMWIPKISDTQTE